MRKILNHDIHRMTRSSHAEFCLAAKTQSASQPQRNAQTWLALVIQMSGVQQHDMNSRMWRKTCRIEPTHSTCDTRISDGKAPLPEVTWLIGDNDESEAMDRSMLTVQ